MIAMNLPESGQLFYSREFHCDHAMPQAAKSLFAEPREAGWFQFEKTVFGFGPRAAAGTREGNVCTDHCCSAQVLMLAAGAAWGQSPPAAGSNGADPDTARARSTAGEARFGVGDAATGCRVSGADRGDRARSCGRKARVHRGARFSCASAPA